MTQCDVMADLIIEALEEGRTGAVRQAVDNHAPHCERCRERVGALRAMAEGLDPPVPAPSPGFVGRVMAEIRGEERSHVGAYDRLPPLWQVLGAGGLMVALAAIVLAIGTGTEAAWHTRALTGFLHQSLGFLGTLSHGITGLWETVVPGRALPILATVAAVATALNIAFVVGALRRHKKTVE
ncbi:MAG: hypothetical protein ACI9OJ_000655 [Myxococcota bacterium]|jgi:hypothetical protein